MREREWMDKRENEWEREWRRERKSNLQLDSASSSY